jgi:hypothetical protein
LATFIWQIGLRAQASSMTFVCRAACGDEGVFLS